MNFKIDENFSVLKFISNSNNNNENSNSFSAKNKVRKIYKYREANILLIIEYPEFFNSNDW